MTEYCYTHKLNTHLKQKKTIIKIMIKCFRTKKKWIHISYNLEKCSETR